MVKTEKPRKILKAEKRKLSDRERHKRFLDTAGQVDASDSPDDFDFAFDKIMHKKSLTK